MVSVRKLYYLPEEREDIPPFNTQLIRTYVRKIRSFSSFLKNKIHEITPYDEIHTGGALGISTSAILVTSAIYHRLYPTAPYGPLHFLLVPMAITSVGLVLHGIFRK